MSNFSFESLEFTEDREQKIEKDGNDEDDMIHELRAYSISLNVANCR